MKKGPFKMKGMGFGVSPVKQKGFIRTPDSFDHGKARADAKKRVAEQKARDAKTAKMNKIKNIGKNVAKGAGRLLGGAGLLTTMYDMYKSGQKKSGGKTVKGQETGIVTPDKSKSIYSKPKKSIYKNNG